MKKTTFYRTPCFIVTILCLSCGFCGAQPGDTLGRPPGKPTNSATHPTTDAATETTTGASAGFDFGFEDISLKNDSSRSGGVSSGGNVASVEKRVSRLATVGSYATREELETKNRSGDSGTEKTVEALLLKTGFVQKGKATLEKKLYVVQGPYSRIRIPSSQVEYAGTDIHDVYRYKLSRPGTDTYSGAYAMGKWCLSNGMYEEAIMEFERGKAYATYPQAVSKLDREIETVEKVRAHSGRYEKTAVATPDSGNVDAESPDQSPPAEYDDFDYKEWSASVPPEVLTAFRKEIQPVLVKRCAGPECHGANSSQEFRIEYPLRKYSVNETAARNMKNTLQWFDYENLANSPLILKPLEEHGGTKPIFNAKTKKQLVAIYQWSRSVATEMPEYVANIRETNEESERLFRELRAGLGEKIDDEAGNETSRAAGSQRETVPEGDIEQVSHLRTVRPQSNSSQKYEFPGKHRPLEEFSFPGNGFPSNRPLEIEFREKGFEIMKRKTASPKRRSDSDATPQTADPFDPSVFNRAFHE